MNTRIFSKLLMAAFILFSFGSCQKDVYEIYDVNEIEVLPINAQKTKAKRDAQYISILYTNYFQEPIGPSKLLQALDAIRSVGDKQIAYDMIVSKYLTNAPIIPSKAEMDADPEELLREALAEMSASKAAGKVAKLTGLDRQTLYARAVEMKSS